VLRKYMIEREVNGIGNNTPDGLCAIAQTSKNVLDRLSPNVQWVESFVASDKAYCVFLAADESVIRKHAEQTGFPANRIVEIRSMLDPTMAPA
jgi:hypothetical protein